ncbi:MAG: DUF4118 domain-containing protein, partial [Myxococcales bacterium]|nr:DUF4118 domain-containing protein [Myxococcales bacterium]
MDDGRTTGGHEGRGPAAGVGRLAIEYGQGLLAVAIATALASLLRARVAEPDLVMVYLLGVVLVASRVRLGPALATALLSVAAFDLFLVEPVYTFDVADARYVITFVVMAGVGVVLSSLTARLRLQARRAREAEARTAALYQLSHELVGDDELETLARTVAQAIERAFACDAAIFVVDDACAGGLRLAAAAGEAIQAPSR